MQHTKRWLAALLAMTMTLSDCGGMTVLATENNDTAISSASENNVGISEKSTSEGEEKKSNDAETDSEADIMAELPALHIGQIKEGEALPATDDLDFSYDLPISFETSDCLLLFANYSIDTNLEPEKGTLAWSILRGQNGLQPGSASLLDEEDDWIGFETVSASPFFVMEEITDEESDYYQMMALTPAKTSSAVDDIDIYETENTSENYDYYIRAAYYPETENGKAEAFYAAATIPFVPQKMADTEQNQEDISGSEEIPTDGITDEVSVSENNADTADSEILDESSEDATVAEKNDTEDTSENTDLESAEADQTSEEISTLSENSSSEQFPLLAEDDEPQPLEEESDIRLILYQGTEIVDTNILDEKEQITMSPGDTQQITAGTEPEMTQSDISWETSDETVATVTAGENGTVTITAIAEGYARITVSCRSVTASITVDVVLDKANLGNDKLLDLSGDIRVAGFEKESNSLVYSGQKITQNLRVYHKNTLLKEKTDYTLSYKNNVNAAELDSVNAPSVTINLKGQYQGSVTLFYTIKPLDINNIDSNNTGGNSPGYEQIVNYSKKLNIPAPVLTFGKKKLAVKKDFICDYATPGDNLTPLPSDIKDGTLYEAGKIYSYTVRGTGNFTGSFLMQLVVLNDKKLNFSSASVKLDKKQYEYHGTPLTKSDVKIQEVKLGGNILGETDYVYEVYSAGTTGAYVMLSPTPEGREAGYRGSKKVTLKLVGDRQIKDAVPGADWKESISFSQKTVDKDGGIFQKGTALLAYTEGEAEKPLSAETDYTIKYSNAKKAGKVTVTFTGKGRYKGSLRLTYTITPNTDIKIFPGKNVINRNGNYEVAYQKDGAMPELILKDQDYTVLKNKTDYTIKYKDNKTPGTSMTCEITGKGNYKGYQKTVALTVTPADISMASISIPDRPYSNKTNKWQSTVTITDVNGKKLTAGKDYDKTIIYDYKQEQSPPAGTTVSVTVNGLGCYGGSSITGTYRIFAKNISALKIVIDPQEYTGEEIKLNQNYRRDIHVYASNADMKKKNELWEDCYEILEYKNNIKSGTAKVTLRGIGNYGGTKTYSFKIQKKKYRINHVKGIKLDKTSLSFPLAETDTAKRTLIATLTAETWEPIANPTVIWTTSNSSIVDIEVIPTTPESYAAGKVATSRIILTLKKEGSVTITAIAQDGKKKAQCKVSVIDAPLLKEAGETIKEEIGKTYQLHMEFTESQDPNKVSWESSNPNAVSVKEGLLTMNKAGAAIIKAVYKSGNRSYAQECYAVAIDPNEKTPEGKVLSYEQKPGTTDDTPYINNHLREWERNKGKYDCMYIPAGVYHIDAVNGLGGIVLTENQTLIMSPSALLVAIPNNCSKDFQVIYAFGRENITISGGQILGERKAHKGKGGESGHGINISGCTNVTIENIEISQCWGDGIYLGLYSGTKKGCRRVTITNCNLHHNRRSNLSITNDVSNVTVSSCRFNYANGTAPQYGINIEPGQNTTCSNITISDSSFYGNAGGTIQILGQLNAHVKDVTIENCKGDKKPLEWSGFGGSVSGVKQKNNNWNWHP